MIVFIHGHDNASNYTISLLFQPVVSYVHNDVYIFHIDLMQNHNFQIVLPRAQGGEVKVLRMVSCYWPVLCYRPIALFSARAILS